MTKRVHRGVKITGFISLVILLLLLQKIDGGERPHYMPPRVETRTRRLGLLDASVTRSQRGRRSRNRNTSGCSTGFAQAYGITRWCPHPGNQGKDPKGWPTCSSIVRGSILCSHDLCRRQLRRSSTLSEVQGAGGARWGSADIPVKPIMAPSQIGSQRK